MGYIRQKNHSDYSFDQILYNSSNSCTGNARSEFCRKHVLHSAKLSDRNATQMLFPEGNAQHSDRKLPLLLPTPYLKKKRLSIRKP